MRRVTVVVVSVMFAAGLCGIVVAGSIEPSGPPTAGSGMYTLQNLYDYLMSGTALTVQGSFQEPIVAPGSTMKTTKEIGDALKSSYEQCSTTAVANVESGKPFFCTQPGSWGVQTGTLVVPPTPTPTWMYPDVVVIGGMYVARSKDGPGCAGNATKKWVAANSWASGLSWLGLGSGWRLPSAIEYGFICSMKNTHPEMDVAGSYWTATGDATNPVLYDLIGCSESISNSNYLKYVRVVRSMY
ncbi:MAG: hypothetical protein NTZ78_09610 [Candidatus Aureabacteria bacterium]|nr:hypothetical protein [Candidatus Auribacterota bacterium]